MCNTVVAAAILLGHLRSVSYCVSRLVWCEYCKLQLLCIKQLHDTYVMFVLSSCQNTMHVEKTCLPSLKIKISRGQALKKWAGTWSNSSSKVAPGSHGFLKNQGQLWCRPSLMPIAHVHIFILPRNFLSLILAICAPKNIKLLVPKFFAVWRPIRWIHINAKDVRKMVF